MEPATPAQSARLTGQSLRDQPQFIKIININYHYFSLVELPAVVAPHHLEFVVYLRRAVTAALSLRTQLTSPRPPGSSARPAS